MRAGVLVLAALLVALFGARAALAQAPPCSKADFEAVVDEAAGALRGLAQQNTPHFQASLRQLKAKRGWSDDQFLKEAEPLVRDEKITGFDRTSEELLARITGAGQAGAAGAPRIARCSSACAPAWRRWSRRRRRNGPTCSKRSRASCASESGRERGSDPLPRRIVMIHDVAARGLTPSCGTQRFR